MAAAVRISQQLQRLVPQLRYEPTPKRLRARLGDALVLDSRRAIVLWEPGRFLPVHAVPEEDVVASLEANPPDTCPSAQHTADGEPLAVRVDGELAPGAAFRLGDPDLKGYVTFDTDAFDWFEEEEPVIGHPRDPFSRIDIRTSVRHVRVLLDGVVLAETTRPTMLFEGQLPPRTYFSAEEVHWERLEPVDLVTICPYKGHARYWAAPGLGDGRPVAWSYGPEFPEMAQIHGLIAFFDERTDVEVDGERVARPGTHWS
jgi:uncharacterized protein (DUF427 family)